MPIVRARIETNLRNVRERIGAAAERAGRSPQRVRLVAVTKTAGLDETEALLSLGVTEFGENRVEGAAERLRALSGAGSPAPRARWHMIGNLQRRKAREAVALFDTVDAVDRIELAEALDRRCGEVGERLEQMGGRLPILLEVNVSGEPSKHGFRPEEVPKAVEQITALARLRLEGLMTMAPLLDDPELTRPVFALLRELAERVGVPELSMGMSNDFEVAVEEGATQVRLGTVLFQ